MVTPTPTTVQVKLQLRGDTAATWASVNPVLLNNELGLETDTKKFKIGNGSTSWNSLAYFPSIVSGGTVLGNLEIGTTGTLTFEGSTADGFETTLAVTDPTADRTITLPDQSGTVVVTGNASIVNADIAADAEIAVSKLANGTANQVLVTDGTDVSWSDDLTLAGNLTVNGTTTTVNTETLTVKDKNIELAVVDTPTDTTADGGGITLKGATDKTFNWVDSTDAWTSSEHVNLASGKAYYINGTEVLSGSALGSAVEINTSQNITLQAQADLRFADADSSNWVAFQAPATVASNVTWTLPDADGTSGQVLSTDGAGALSWTTAAAGGASVTTSDTAPVSPSDGDLWYDSVGGRLYVYYDDGDTSQWVDAAPQGGGGGATDKIEEGNTSAEVIDTGSDGRFVVTTEGTQRFTVNGGYALLGAGNATATSPAGSYTQYTPLHIVGGIGTNNGGGVFIARNTPFTGLTNQDLGSIVWGTNEGAPFTSIAAFMDGSPTTGSYPGYLSFRTTASGASSPTERMRITNEGSVHAFTTNSTTGYYSIRNSGADSGRSALAFFKSASSTSDGTLCCIVRQDGDLENTNNSYGALSDIKLKENIVDANSQWSDLKALQVRNYTFKPETGHSTHTQIGLIAQEVEQVSPGLVSESPDLDEEGNDLGTVTKSVNYSVLYMKAVKALQEAMERIETLEAQNASLEARLTAIEGGN